MFATTVRGSPTIGYRIVLSHCQQERQQWCWKSVGPDSGGAVLDSSAELSIFTPETTLEAIDSGLLLP